MLAVGIGPGAPDSELKSIAMENSDNVMKIGSFDQLAGNLQKITKHLCQGKVGQLLLCGSLESDRTVSKMSAYEPSGLSGWRVFRFLWHEATRSISSPPLDWILVYCRATPSIKFARTHFYTWAKRGTVRIKFLYQKHNTMSPTRNLFVESPGNVSITQSRFKVTP